VELNTDGLRKNHAQTVGQKKRRGFTPPRLPLVFSPTSSGV
jgi:hypothetical protein